jgi:AcrR family transcriptional regulator
MGPGTLQRKAKGSYHHGNLERALIEAALTTIRDDGVSALTLRAVGARLGVSRTALYRHFEDKAALLARVAAEGFRLLHAALAGARDAAPAGGGDALQAMARAYVRFALANQSHFATMFGGHLEDWSRYPDLIAAATGAFDVLLETITVEQEDGRIVDGDPIELAEIAWSMSHGVATLGAARHLQRTATSVEDLAVLACGLLEDGLRPARPRARSARRRRAQPASTCYDRR